MLLLSPPPDNRTQGMKSTTAGQLPVWIGGNWVGRIREGRIGSERRAGVGRGGGGRVGGAGGWRLPDVDTTRVWNAITERTRW